jgi:hypothetical protein
MACYDCFYDGFGNGHGIQIAFRNQWKRNLLLQNFRCLGVDEVISTTAEVRSTPHERCRAYPCNDRAKGTSQRTDWFDHFTLSLLAFVDRVGSESIPMPSGA